MNNNTERKYNRPTRGEPRFWRQNKKKLQDLPNLTSNFLAVFRVPKIQLAMRRVIEVIVCLRNVNPWVVNPRAEIICRQVTLQPAKNQSKMQTVRKSILGAKNNLCSTLPRQDFKTLVFQIIRIIRDGMWGEEEITLRPLQTRVGKVCQIVRARVQRILWLRYWTETWSKMSKIGLVRSNHKVESRIMDRARRVIYWQMDPWTRTKTSRMCSMQNIWGLKVIGGWVLKFLITSAATTLVIRKIKITKG